MALRIVGAIISLLCLHSSLAFPDGGPIDACVKQKANQPNHDNLPPQPIDSLPYIVEASANYYRPGDVITVTIRGEGFKGFFFQGRDGQTNEWVGTFEKGPENKSYKECSATTHTNNKIKDSVVLVWHAPADRGGEVYFIGTVLKSYKYFWSDVVAAIPR